MRLIVKDLALALRCLMIKFDQNDYICGEMKTKIVIKASNKKAIDAIQKLQDQKRKLQKLMALDKPISQLKEGLSSH